MALGAVLLAALVACGGGDKGGGAPAATDISGTYLLIGDVGGTQVRTGASVTLTLKSDGTLALRAIQPGEELTDSGTWSIKGDEMTIAIKDLGISAKDAPFKVEGDRLELPLQIFGDGPGASSWRKGDAAAAQASPAPGTSPSAQGNLGVSFTVPTNWQIYDLDKYATAASMKAFLESVNDRGQSWEDAVKTAVAKARTFSDVADVQLSPNGLNATIKYRDGRDEYLITERFSLTQPEGRGSLPSPSNYLYASAGAPRLEQRPPTPMAAYASAKDCSSVPSMTTSITKAANGANLPEPGREGLQARAGVFLVPTYNPNDQPKPVKSDDTPDARKALIFAPLYDVPHPGPVYAGGAKTTKAGLWTGFRDGTGDNIACVMDDLGKGGYKFDTVLGKVSGNQRQNTGLDALVQLTKLLTTNDYGVIYFLTHGAEVSDSLLKVQMGALDEADRRRITGDGRLGHESVMKLQDTIREQALQAAGLPKDDEIGKSIYAVDDINGFIQLWVSANYFKLLREKKGLDFSETLVFINACSSAANMSLQAAFQAKVYFGWDQPPDLEFAADAAETIFDLLPDKARSARNAWQMWVRHESWVEQTALGLGAAPRPARAKIEILKAYGQFGLAYPRLADQSVALIYRMRFGPPAGADRLQGAINVVTACWTQFWSAGQSPSGLQSPACGQIQLSSNRAVTKEEYEDAVFEVGGPITLPYGRWTLAD